MKKSFRDWQHLSAGTSAPSVPQATVRWQAAVISVKDWSRAHRNPRPSPPRARAREASRREHFDQPALRLP